MVVVVVVVVVLDDADADADGMIFYLCNVTWLRIVLYCIVYIINQFFVFYVCPFFLPCLCVIRIKSINNIIYNM